MMKLFIQETKKILRPLPLFILAVFTVLYTYVFIESTFSYMTEYHETSDMVALCADLVELCGPTLEPEEIEPAVETLSARYISDLETKIKANPLFAEAGVTDYASYRALEIKTHYSYVEPEMIQDGEYQIDDWPAYDLNTDYSLNPAEQKIEQQNLMFDMVPAIKLKLLNLNIVRAYEDISIDGKLYPEGVILTESPTVQKKLINIYESGAIRTVLPGWTMYHINRMYPMLAIMILATLCILLAPFITKDNMNGIIVLQYSGKIGRKTLGVQFAAMLFTAFVVAVVEITVVFGLFVGEVWHSFLSSGLNSFLDTFQFNWFSGNYGQYLLIISIMILAVSLAAAMLIFVLSKLCKNYISLILGLVPLSSILIFLCYLVFKAPFAMIRSTPFSIQIPYVEAYIVGMLLLVGIIVSTVLLKKQKRVEIM